jgi:uncharacterized membrane protein HdeD (DUF308 family)
MRTPLTLDASDPKLGEQAARAWWLFGLLGLLSLIAGIILVTEPSHSLKALAVIFGIFLLFDGIVALFSSITGPAEGRTLHVVLGVLAIIAGLILVRHPEHAVNAVGLLIGIWLVVAGCLRLVLAILGLRSRLPGIIGAVLEIVVGVVIVSQPHIGYATLAIISGIWLILNAFALLAVSFIAHRLLSHAPTSPER